METSDGGREVHDPVKGVVVRLDTIQGSHFTSSEMRSLEVWP